jgi:DNA-binding MarR family transcriptional regulator
MAKLSRAEIAVWLILYRDTKDGVARTAQSDLARRAGVNERTVRRAIKKLVRKGLLEVVRQGGLVQGMSVYRVKPPCLNDP